MSLRGNKTAASYQGLAKALIDCGITKEDLATAMPKGAKRKAMVSDKKNKIPKEVFVGGQDATVKFAQSRAITSNMSMVNGVQTMIVEKTEAVDTIQTTSSAFVAAARPFIPQSTNFPWLSSISSAFTEYQVLELEYTYVPSVPTTQGGNIMLAFTGDYSDSNPADQNSFLQSEQALLAPVYAGGAGGRALQKFGFPPGDVVGFSVPKYTYSLGTTNMPITYRIASSTSFTSANVIEKNTLSPGQLVYAVNGVTVTPSTTLVVGQLFVRYKIRLLGSVKASLNN